MIDGIARPIRVLDGREGGLLGLLESPVQVVGRTLLDPFVEDGDLVGRDLFAALRGRHLLVLVGGMDAHREIALLQIAGDNGVHAVLFRERAFAGVDPAVALAIFRIEAVTLEAVLGKDRPHIAVKVDLVREGGVIRQQAGGGDQGEECEEWEG